MLSGGRWIRVATHVSSRDKGEKEINVNCNPVAPRFFETMGIPVVLGRDFTEADGQLSPRVTVVSESFARRYFSNEVALGKQLRFKDEKGEQIVVVGIVKEVKALSLRERESLPAASRWRKRPLIFSVKQQWKFVRQWNPRLPRLPSERQCTMLMPIYHSCKSSRRGRRPNAPCKMKNH